MIIAIALYQQESPSFYRHGHLHPSHRAVERPLVASRRASPTARLPQMVIWRVYNTLCVQIIPGSGEFLLRGLGRKNGIPLTLKVT